MGTVGETDSLDTLRRFDSAGTKNSGSRSVGAGGIDVS